MNFGIAQMHITGQVVDEKGEPVTGATIQVKTKKNLGGITDVNGRFSISVPANSILIISYMGYKTQEVKATQKTENRAASGKQCLAGGRNYRYDGHGQTPFHRCIG